MKTWRTMTAMILALALAGATLAAEPAAGQGQDKAQQPNAQEETKKNGAAPVADPTTKLQLGLELAKQARQSQSPALMLAAVQLIKQVSPKVEPLKAEKSSEEAKGDKNNPDAKGGVAAPAEAGKKAAEPTLDVAKLLAEAKGWAQASQDKTMMTALDEEAQRKPLGTLGRLPGSIDDHIDRVSAFSTDTYRMVFEGGEPAIVTVSGDGDTDLDLYIYDEHGHLVESDTDSTDDCICRWVPRWTGTFTVRIKNLGDVWNRYVLNTN